MLVVFEISVSFGPRIKQRMEAKLHVFGARNASGWELHCRKTCRFFSFVLFFLSKAAENPGEWSEKLYTPPGAMVEPGDVAAIY